MIGFLEPRDPGETTGPVFVEKGDPVPSLARGEHAHPVGVREFTVTPFYDQTSCPRRQATTWMP